MLNNSNQSKQQKEQQLTAHISVPPHAPIPLLFIPAFFHSPNIPHLHLYQANVQIAVSVGNRA